MTGSSACGMMRELQLGGTQMMLLGALSDDAVPVVAEALAAEESSSLSVIVQSAGGSPYAAYLLGRLFAERDCHVYVPQRAKSSATLLSLAAKEIHFGSTAALGPLIPTVTWSDPGGHPRGLSLGDVRAIRALHDECGLPARLVLGRVLEHVPVARVLEVVALGESVAYMGRTLLVKGAGLRHELAGRVVGELMSHAHHDLPILLEDARQHGLPVSQMPRGLEAVLSDLVSVGLSEMYGLRGAPVSPQWAVVTEKNFATDVHVRSRPPIPPDAKGPRC